MASNLATAEAAAPNFAARASVALQDDGLRRKFRRAMDGLMTKRAAQFPGSRRLGAACERRGAAIRRRTLARLPELLEQLEARCRANGIQVHWAETSADADRIIQGILTDHGVRTVIKGKSMVSEEIHLNDFLAQHQIAAVESDLGEFVIQLAHETPSHIIMPCIHKSREDVATLFRDHIADQPYTDDVDALTATARRVLREQFAAADAGLSGVNFAIAETGTLCLVENEGNGRLSTTLPPLHVAVMGLEKVVERLEDVPPLLIAADPLGHRSGDYHLCQLHLGPPSAKASRTGRARCTLCCSTTAARASSAIRNCARPSPASAAAPA